MTAALTLYPAIDLKAGQCVRLVQGEMTRATIYNEDPAAQAHAFREAGFDWIHIVDLDGAFSGKSENAAAVETILKASAVKAQLGGGVRSIEAVAFWLGRGVARVILGTAAVRNPALVKEAAREFPGRVVVGLDAKEGRVRTDGWAGDSGMAADEVAKRFEGEGVAAIIYTDISRDGALAGVNVEATRALAAAVAVPVIASGGVAGIADISRIAAAKPAIEGVVIGRALYDGRIDGGAARQAARR